MTLGEQLLYVLARDNRLQDFGRIKRDWLAESERPTYDRMLAFLQRYGRLPEAILPEGEDAPEFNSDFYTDELIKRHLTLEMSELGSNLSSMCGSANYMEAFVHMEEFVYRMKKELLCTRDLFPNGGTLISTVLEKIPGFRVLDGLIGVPTGWPTLDHTSRGFQPKNLYIILARPKMGKSVVIMNMAIAAYRAGKIPMIVSMEMAAIEMARRMIGIMLGIPAGALKSGQVSQFGEIKIRQLAAEMEHGIPFYFLEGQFRKTIAELTSLVHALKPDIVYVDGGYLLKAVGNSKAQKWERMSEVAEDLKTLSMVANVPLVVSFQFNRKVKSEDPKTAGWDTVHLSDAISQIASVGLGIFSPKNAKRYRKVELIGGREGEEGTFDINWNWDKMDFSERREADEMRGIVGADQSEDVPRSVPVQSSEESTRTRTDEDEGLFPV